MKRTPISILSRFLLLFVAMCLIIRPTFAGDCQYVGQTCTQGPETRNIGGVAVYRDCWNYQSTYQCLKPNSVDYCAALAADSQCTQTSTKCSQTMFDGSCGVETRTYQCSDGSMQTPANTVVLDKTYTITKDQLDTTQCAPYSAAGSNCQLASHTCTQGPETRVINGLPVYKDCWQYQDDYTCFKPDPQDNCADLNSNPACTFVSENCQDNRPGVGCVQNTRSYSCVTRQGTTTTTQDCSTKSTCVGNTCWQTGSPPDGDFAAAVIGNEIARQGSTYMDENGLLFDGVPETCREGWGGIKHCCTMSPGAKTNHDFLGVPVTSINSMLYKVFYNIGSKFNYDFIFNSDFFVKIGAKFAAAAGTGVALAAAAGVSVAADMDAAASAIQGGASVVGSAGGELILFNPTTLIIAVAIMVIMNMMSCDSEEQMLGMHRQQHLSHFIGTYCSQKTLGVCSESRQSYCSFNSVLARIIQEAGHDQLGKSWGTPDKPDCLGFSTTDFGKIDFSKVDFSEFVPDVMNAADQSKLPDINTSDLVNKLTNQTTNNPNDNTPKMPYGLQGP